MCHKAWSERFKFFSIDNTKTKKEGEHRIINESKTTYIECFPKSELF